MTLSVILTLFSAMLVLAVIPGPGIFIVVARTLSQGFSAGVVTSMGIVAGDYVYIILAVAGLATVAQLYSELFLIIQYMCAAYLAWLGGSLLVGQWRLRHNKDRITGTPDKTVQVLPSRQWANFSAGLLTTLSNPKAVLFYVSFFPAFLDLSQVSYFDIGIILLVVTIAVGGVMVMYAYMVHKTGSFIKDSAASVFVSYLCAFMMFAFAGYIALRG